MSRSICNGPFDARAACPLTGFTLQMQVQLEVNLSFIDEGGCSKATFTATASFNETFTIPRIEYDASAVPVEPAQDFSVIQPCCACKLSINQGAFASAAYTLNVTAGTAYTRETCATDPPPDLLANASCDVSVPLTLYLSKQIGSTVPGAWVWSAWVYANSPDSGVNVACAFPGGLYIPLSARLPDAGVSLCSLAELGDTFTTVVETASPVIDGVTVNAWLNKVTWTLTGTT